MTFKSAGGELSFNCRLAGIVVGRFDKIRYRFVSVFRSYAFVGIPPCLSVIKRESENIDEVSGFILRELCHIFMVLVALIAGKTAIEICFHPSPSACNYRIFSLSGSFFITKLRFPALLFRMTRNRAAGFIRNINLTVNCVWIVFRIFSVIMRNAERPLNADPHIFTWFGHWCASSVVVIVSVCAVADCISAFNSAYTAVSAFNVFAFVFNAFVVGNVAYFAIMTVCVTVAVRVNDDAASVRRLAFLPVFACYFFAFVFDARFCRIIVFVDISFRTFADCIITFEFTSAVTAVERAFRRIGTAAVSVFDAVAVFILFVVVDAFAVFFTFAVDIAERVFAAFKRAVFVDACRNAADCFRFVTVFAVTADSAALVGTSAAVAAAVTRTFYAFAMIVAGYAFARTGIFAVMSFLIAFVALAVRIFVASAFSEVACAVCAVFPFVTTYICTGFVFRNRFNAFKRSARNKAFVAQAGCSAA